MLSEAVLGRYCIVSLITGWFKQPVDNYHNPQAYSVMDYSAYSRHALKVLGIEHSNDPFLSRWTTKDS